MAEQSILSCMGSTTTALEDRLTNGSPTYALCLDPVPPDHVCSRPFIDMV